MREVWDTLRGVRTRGSAGQQNCGLHACVLKVSATEREKPSRYMRVRRVSPFWLMKRTAAIIAAPVSAELPLAPVHRRQQWPLGRDQWRVFRDTQGAETPTSAGGMLRHLKVMGQILIIASCRVNATTFVDRRAGPGRLPLAACSVGTRCGACCFHACAQTRARARARTRTRTRACGASSCAG